MKNALILFLTISLLLSLAAGCSEPQQSPPISDAGSSNTIPSGTTEATFPSTSAPEVTPPTVSPAPTLPEPELPELDKPLFFGYTHDFTYHYVNREGEILCESPQHFYSENGLAAAHSPITRSTGFIDKDGVFVIEPQFADARPFGKNGLAAVAVYVATDEKDYWGNYTKWGYINAQGEIVIPCEYYYAAPFNESGYAVVAKTIGDDIALGVIDSKGKFCIPLDTNPRNITLGTEYMIIEYLSPEDTYTKPTIAAYQETVSIYKTELRDYSNNIIDHCTTKKTDRIIPETIVDQYRQQYEDQVRWNPFDQNYHHFFSEADGAYLCKQGDIFKYKYTDYTYDETNIPTDSKTTIYCLSDGKFKEVEYDYTTDTKQVATTITGYGTKITYRGNDISTYEYDHIQHLPGSRYLLAFKFQNYDGSEHTIDIFDIQTGTRTAQNIPYTLCSENFEYILPDGYYMVMVDEIRCYGIVDHTGKVIMEPIYKNIILYTYDGLIAEME